MISGDCKATMVEYSGAPSHFTPPPSPSLSPNQSLDEQLHHRDLECAELEANLQEVKRKAQRDKEALKRATR